MADAESAVLDQAKSGFTAISIQATDVVIDGFKGRHVQIAVPLDADVSACDGPAEAEFRLWEGQGGPDGSVWWIPAHAAPGLVGDIYLLDLNGTRAAIQTVAFADQHDVRDVLDVLGEIAGSIDFDLH